MAFIITLLLLAVTLLAISLQRTYANIPSKELRRRARAGDPYAQALHRATAYGSSLSTLLGAVTIIATAALFLYVARNTATWFGLLTVVFTIWFGFLWMPARDATRLSAWLAMRLAPALGWLLRYLHPVFSRLIKFFTKLKPVHIHTGMYDKADLLELFERQEVQADNRVDQAALEMARHALVFADKTVATILTPRRVVKAVSTSEVVGPVLMTELHESGFSRFPVYDGKTDNMVGVLYLRDLVKAKAGGEIGKVMHRQVCYIHEDQSLYDALQAILKTHQQLFVVVNSFEEYVGVVTIEDIMEEIVGHQIIDEFDQYEDMRAVANRMAQRDHQDHKDKDAEDASSVG